VVLHPVGSLPPRAYWLRRLLVLLAVIIVIALLWWLIGRASGDSGSPAAGPSASGSSPGPSSSSPSATTSTTGSATTTPSATTSKPSSTGSAAPGLCPDSVIKVVSLTSEPSYPAGSPAKLSVQVTNTGPTPCKRDVGQAALELIVSSGSSRVWSSDDCNPGGGHAVVTLRSGQVFATTVSWDRQKSAPGCPSGQPPAGPGHYTLVARNLTVNSAPTAFALQ
jgi:cytoskeletal protein RodZ